MGAELHTGDSFMLVTKDKVLVCQVVSIRDRGDEPLALDTARPGEDETVITIDSEELLSRVRTRRPKY